MVTKLIDYRAPNLLAIRYFDKITWLITISIFSESPNNNYSVNCVRFNTTGREPYAKLELYVLRIFSV